jgi:ketosteroid isomerase-like protein
LQKNFLGSQKIMRNMRPLDNCVSSSLWRKIAMNRKEAIMGIATIAAAAAIPSVANAQKPETEGEAENPELEPLRALLKAYDTAFTNQDLSGVMATMSEKAAIMGSGPGEIWSGADEIKAAHQKLFEGFDARKQSFDYEFNIGQVMSDSGWMLTSGNVTGTKGGEEFTFPVNISLTATKQGGKWLIAAMHFSTVTDESEEE